jgi:hypothetical protein
MGRQAYQERFSFAERNLPINFGEEGTTRQAYLIRLLPRGYHGDLVHSLNVTDGHHIESIRKFVFDGYPFEGSGIEPHKDRQLFAGHPVLKQHPTHIEFGVTNFDNARNWLAGNSFTSSLNTQAIARYLIDYIPHIVVINEEPIWIFPHGGTNYERFDLNNPNLPNIPAMGIFMIRAAVNTDIHGQFLNIGPQFQIHARPRPGIFPFAGDAEQTGLRSGQTRSNSMTLVLTPENNQTIFSRTEILFNENASLHADNVDIRTNRDNPHMFQLSGTNNDVVRLQRNALPHTAEMALLRVDPAVDGMWVTLTALGADNFAADIVELYDRQTGQFIQDLRANNTHTFWLDADDNPDRFEVRFAPRSGTTDVDDNHIANWSIYNNRSELTVTGLSHTLIGETIRIISAAGVLQIQQPINSSVEYINIQDLPSGVYLITIQGRTEKFVK